MVSYEKLDVLMMNNAHCSMTQSLIQWCPDSINIEDCNLDQWIPLSMMTSPMNSINL